MNHQLAADLMRKHTYGLAMAILFALTITPHAHAENDEPSDTQGQWHNNVSGGQPDSQRFAFDQWSSH